MQGSAPFRSVNRTLLSVTVAHSRYQGLSLALGVCSSHVCSGEVLILLSDGAGEDKLLRTQWTAPEPSPGELAAALVEQGAEEGDGRGLL